MNKQPEQMDSISFFAEAEACFPKGIIARMRSRGHQIIECEREGSFFYDAEGQKLIDCYSSASIYNLGRRNPELMAELKKASREVDQGVFIMISEQKVAMAKALAEFCPGNLECSLLQVVRGEAFDAACKLARGYTGRSELISVDGGCYGTTGFAMSLSQHPDKSTFGNLIPDTKLIPFNDNVQARKAISNKTAAVILETTQVENHCRTASESYLQDLRTFCDDTGALLIIDETQTGFGRTGNKFSFLNYYGIQPDIMIIGEAVCGGVFPVCGMVYGQSVKRFFDEHPLIHLNTFGGHDLGCLMVVKALELYERAQPWHNAAEKGNLLLTELQRLARVFPNCLKSVSGSGLLVSLELVDEKTANNFCKLGVQKGIFALPGELSKHCVPLRPSLLIGDEDLGFMLRAVSDTLKALS